MKDIAIYGAGGFGREIACLLNLINKRETIWNFIGFFDDVKDNGYETGYGKVIGGINDLNEYTKKISILFAIGNPQIVSSLVSSINNKLVDFPNIISPDVLFLDETSVTFGKGNLICSNCWISCNVHFGNFNSFNVGITIGHDSRIGDFNSFMPATRISGGVIIGNRNFFGVSSVVLQQITIGKDTVIGANSLVIKKTKDGETYIGSPAIKVKY